MANPHLSEHETAARLGLDGRRPGGQVAPGFVAPVPGPAEASAPHRLGRSDASVVVRPPFRAASRARRASTISAGLVLGGDLIAFGAATFANRPAERAGMLYVLVALVALAWSGAYRLRLNLSSLEETPRLAATLALPLLVIAPVAGSLDQGLLLQALASVGGVVAVRALTYSLIRRARARGMTERTIVAGTGPVGFELVEVIRRHPEYGLDFVGFVGAPSRNLPGPLLGDVDRLDDIITTQGVRRVLVAFGPTREAEMVGVVRTAVQRDVEVHVVPRFFEIGVAPRGPDVDDLWGIPVYRVRQAALRARSWWLKRALDLVVSALLLLVLAPLFAIVAAAVRLSSPGPALFRQHRIGQDGRDIWVLKFRTMTTNDDSETYWSVDVGSDERLTAVGRFLRRTSIDELPQLVNVLKGEMSLVGPRPERPYFVHRFSSDIAGYGDRHRTPAGLTGWAQVHGLKGDTSIRERARFDNQYIEHWSIWRDLVILSRTLVASLRPPARTSAPEPVVHDQPVDTTFGYTPRATGDERDPGAEHHTA